MKDLGGRDTNVQVSVSLENLIFKSCEKQRHYILNIYLNKVRNLASQVTTHT